SRPSRLTFTVYFIGRFLRSPAQAQLPAVTHRIPDRFAIVKPRVSEFRGCLLPWGIPQPSLCKLLTYSDYKQALRCDPTRVWWRGRPIGLGGRLRQGGGLGRAGGGASHLLFNGQLAV